jgi:hypothetical protein
MALRQLVEAAFFLAFQKKLLKNYVAPLLFKN